MNSEDTRAYAIQSEPVEKQPTLAERVEYLENALKTWTEQVDTNAAALGRIGARLKRAEHHVGLPSFDVDDGIIR